jgi:hypothetical protein
MVDRVTMAGLRGFDESIRFARLHLDSRFCLTAMQASLDCELLGRIFHINHRNAYTNRPNDYPGRRYAFDANLPYLNPPDWGLARMAWTREDDRTWRISLPAGRSSGVMPPSLTGPEIVRADTVTRALVERREGTHPEEPRADLPTRAVDLPLEGIRAESHWTGARTEPGSGTLLVTTVESPWGYSAAMPLSAQSTADDAWVWLRVRAKAMHGSVGVGVLHHDQLLYERFFSVHEPVNEVWLPLPPGPGAQLMLRNGADAGPSQVRVEAVTLVTQQRASLRLEEYLLSPP